MVATTTKERLTVIETKLDSLIELSKQEHTHLKEEINDIKCSKADKWVEDSIRGIQTQLQSLNNRMLTIAGIAFITLLTIIGFLISVTQGWI